MLKNFREKDIKPISPQKVSTFEKASLLVLFTFATLIMGPAFIMAANLTNGLLPYTVNGVNGLMGDSGFGWNNSTNTASIQGSNGVASMLQWMNSDRTGYENETVNPTPGNSVIYLPASNEVGISDTQTLTNKSWQIKTSTGTQSATPTYTLTSGYTTIITGIAQTITSMTTNLTNSLVNWSQAELLMQDNGTNYAITWGAGFQNSAGVTNSVLCPSATIAGKILHVMIEQDNGVATCIGAT